MLGVYFVWLGTEKSEVLGNRITVQVNVGAITAEKHGNFTISRLDKTAYPTIATEGSGSLS